MDRSKSIVPQSLASAASSRPSFILAGSEAILAMLDKFTEHAILSAVIDKLRDALGDSRMLEAVRNHPWISWIFLTIIWAAFVYMRSRKGHAPAGSIETPPPAAEPRGATGKQPTIQSKAQASGPSSQAVTWSGNVGGNATVSIGAAKEHRAEHPEIILRIIRVDVDSIRHILPISNAGNESSMVEFHSFITLTFSALNTAPCPASLDTQFLQVQTPSGRPIKCHNITATRMPLEATIPDPPGVFRLENNAPLNYRETLTRFVRYMASETMVFENALIGEPGNIHEFAMRAFAARRQQEAYETSATFRFTISDSYSLTWLAEFQKVNH